MYLSREVVTILLYYYRNVSIYDKRTNVSDTCSLKMFLFTVVVNRKVANCGKLFYSMLYIGTEDVLIYEKCLFYIFLTYILSAAHKKSFSIIRIRNCADDSIGACVEK